AVGLVEGLHNAVDRLDIIKLEAAPEGVGKQFFGQATVKVQPVPGYDGLLDLTQVVELFTGNEFARGIDGFAALAFAPHSQGVEILHRQSERVHAIVAGTAERLASVNLEGLAQGRLVIGKGLLAVLQRGDISRRRRRRNSQDIIQNKQAPFDR